MGWWLKCAARYYLDTYSSSFTLSLMHKDRIHEWQLCDIPMHSHVLCDKEKERALLYLKSSNSTRDCTYCDMIYCLTAADVRSRVSNSTLPKSKSANPRNFGCTKDLDGIALASIDNITTTYLHTSVVSAKSTWHRGHVFRIYTLCTPATKETQMTHANSRLHGVHSATTLRNAFKGP